MTRSFLKKALEEGNNVKLTNDVTRNANEGIVVTKAVTLDLNGHTIYGYETGSSTHYNNTRIFSVYEGGNLTITDGSAGKGGKITNVWGTSAIYVGGIDDSHGEATFEAGTIASGGVYIGDYGKFTMTGGTINTEGDDSGVIVDENAFFTMTGGTITGNYIGVDIKFASSTFTVSGQVNITGNTEHDVSLVYYEDTFTPIHIDGPLAPTARIGVWTDQDVSGINGKTFTKGLNGNGSKANFVSNKSDLVVVTDTSGELAFAAPIIIIAHQATFNGVTKYWATFYHPGNNYRLPEGSQAFYIKENDNDNALYLVGDDGSVIPSETPVIIMSDTDKIGLDKTDQGCDIPGDNKLIGTNNPTNVSDVYVLSEVGGVLGFYKFEGELPAHRAYYVE